MILRTVISWFGLMVLAILNGTFREAALVPRLGARSAHVVSSLLLCALILTVSWFVVPWLEPASGAGAMTIGGLWLLMTLVFELGFGRLVARKSWSELLADYDILAGRVWLLVPLTVFLAPYVVARSRGLL